MLQWTGECPYFFNRVMVFPLDIYPEMRWLAHMVILLFNFWRNFHTAFHSGYTNFKSHKLRTSVPFSLHCYQYLLSFLFYFSFLATLKYIGSDLSHGHDCHDLRGSCGNAGSPTHCARLGINPETQRSQDSTHPVVPQWELQYLLSFDFFFFFFACMVAYGSSQTRDWIWAAAATYATTALHILDQIFMEAVRTGGT